MYEHHHLIDYHNGGGGAVGIMWSLNYYIMIDEIKFNGLDNKPIKTTKKPPPRSIMKISHSFIYTYIICSKGSGKSYLLIKLFIKYEKYPIYGNVRHKLDLMIFEFCPTIHSVGNPIDETLKYLEE
jgi:hypothetical protein